MSIATKVLGELSCLERCHDLMTVERTGHRDLDLLTRFSIAMCAPDVIEASSLLWIADDMVDLLVHAAASLPPYIFTHDVLPWPRAICLSAKPLLSVPPAVAVGDGRMAEITGVQWTDMVQGTPLRAANGTLMVLVHGLSHYHGSDVLSPMMMATLRDGSDWNELTDENEQRIDEWSYKGSDHQSRLMGQMLCTMWLLLRQKVAVRRRAWPDRAAVRRWDRENDKPIPEVTVIELRRPISTAPHDKNEVPVDWSHRWIVDGHWRNQYHPSTNTNVPTWIAPYVKGPEDKPLVVKRRINSWVR